MLRSVGCGATPLPNAALSLEPTTWPLQAKVPFLNRKPLCYVTRIITVALEMSCPRNVEWRNGTNMYDDNDGFFLNSAAFDDDRWLTPLWLITGIVCLLTIAGTTLCAIWGIRQAYRPG